MLPWQCCGRGKERAGRGQSLSVCDSALPYTHALRICLTRLGDCPCSFQAPADPESAGLQQRSPMWPPLRHAPRVRTADDRRGSSFAATVGHAPSPAPHGINVVASSCSELPPSRIASTLARVLPSLEPWQRLPPKSVESRYVPTTISSAARPIVADPVSTSRGPKQHTARLLLIGFPTSTASRP